MQTIGGKVGAAGDLHGISVEESKFLGGDVDHTHLVKGLDYALLQKVWPTPALRMPVHFDPYSQSCMGFGGGTSSSV